MPTIAPYLARATAMPAMPEVAHKLLQSFDRDDVSLPELAALVGRDQALSAKVLRLANSARYSPARSVASLHDAAAALGLRTLRDLTLSACMAGAFPDIPGFDRKAFWRGTMAVAAYAQPLARWLDADEDTAYLGGLMLRTGQLLMLLVEPERMADVATHCSELDSRIGQEQARMGVSHPLISAELARHWRFPTALVQAFNAAADPAEVKPFCRLGATLRLASVIADAREAGVPAADALLQTQAGLVNLLQLDLAWLEEHLPDHRLAVADADALMQ